MTFHKEGIPSLLIVLAFNLVLILVAEFFFKGSVIGVLLYLIGIFFLVVILQFFRKPKRITVTNENAIISPCDGKVVVIEEVKETEYFNDQRIQVSIFMSPLNVHINWFPISGIVKYAKYHAGLFLVAWHPKSSTENERTTVVVEHKSGKEVLFRQIAGALARRIVMYPKVGDIAQQSQEFGFIKFGSRVDLLLPKDSIINVELNQKVKGTQTVIATLA